jgi:hypothetical protein
MDYSYDIIIVYDIIIIISAFRERSKVQKSPVYTLGDISKRL